MLPRSRLTVLAVAVTVCVMVALRSSSSSSGATAHADSEEGVVSIVHANEAREQTRQVDVGGARAAAAAAPPVVFAAPIEVRDSIAPTRLTSPQIAPDALDGYRGKQSQARWRFMEAAVREERGEGVIIDYGAAFGFFSLLTADLNRQWKPWVLSVDDQRQNHGLVYHSSKITEYTLDHCVLCKCPFSIDLINDFARRGVQFHIQFLMSIFHWLPIKDENHHKEVLGNLLALSPVTFIELPHRLEGPGDQRVWYGSRREPAETISDALAHHGDVGTVTLLGATPASGSGLCQRDEMRGKPCTRLTFIVRNSSAKTRFEAAAKGKDAQIARSAMEALQCQGDRRFFGESP